MLKQLARLKPMKRLWYLTLRQGRHRLICVKELKQAVSQQGQTCTWWPLALRQLPHWAERIPADHRNHLS